MTVGVDYNLWLGPAPAPAFNRNHFHYRWHWFWQYGTGELGNNGVQWVSIWPAGDWAWTCQHRSC